MRDREPGPLGMTARGGGGPVSPDLVATIGASTTNGLDGFSVVGKRDLDGVLGRRFLGEVLELGAPSVDGT